MITPVLLSGGSGTRLWPLSRKSYPKQFVPLVGDETLFQASARRLSGAGFAAPLVLTNADFRFIVTDQLAGIGIDPEGMTRAPNCLPCQCRRVAFHAYFCARHAVAVDYIVAADYIET